MKRARALAAEAGIQEATRRHCLDAAERAAARGEAAAPFPGLSDELCQFLLTYGVDEATWRLSPDVGWTALHILVYESKTRQLGHLVQDCTSVSTVSTHAIPVQVRL